jgi:hypothetical protein
MESSAVYVAQQSLQAKAPEKSSPAHRLQGFLDGQDRSTRRDRLAHQDAAGRVLHWWKVIIGRYVDHPLQDHLRGDERVLHFPDEVMDVGLTAFFHDLAACQRRGGLGQPDVYGHNERHGDCDHDGPEQMLLALGAAQGDRVVGYEDVVEDDIV